MKNIYVTWHYTTHGVAYLKHILSKFYLLETLPPEIFLDHLEQEELNGVLNIPKESGFVFDEVIYLTAPQSAFDKLSSRRVSYKKSILEDDLVITQGMKDIFDVVTDFEESNIEAEFAFVRKKYPKKLKKFEQLVWRNIQHYPVKEQIIWLTKYSNFNNVYSEKFKIIELKVDDLRDEKQIATEVSKWSRSYFSKQKNCVPIINVSLGSNETQVVWHILSEEGQLPENVRFIKTYDDKSDSPGKRFKKFSIKETPTNLFAKIAAEIKLFPGTKSPSRKLADMKMGIFLKSGFSILLMGERGLGKSKMAGKAKERLADLGEPLKGAIIGANCAAFADDTMAESQLFGYKKGAFTGAYEERKGLIESAQNGILFLDEIHHLSKPVQARLMKALQTNEKNELTIRRVGANEEIEVKDVKLIFATNNSVAKLRKKLLPDFYDRIVQHVVNIPPLRETKEDRLADWENVWEQLKFLEKGPTPKEKELIEWLEEQPLYGNYRDLQKIAMYYNAFNQFDERTKEMISEASAFQYAKNEFEKYHSPAVQHEKEKFNFNIKQTTKEMLADYLYELQDWAVSKFGARTKAIEHFKSKGDTVTERTFYGWKIKESLNTKKQ